MGGTIPVPTTELVGTFLETLFYGIYLVVFPQCISILVRRPVSMTSKVYFIGTMLVSMLLITMHIVVDLTRAFQAFTNNIDIGGSAEEYFAHVNTPLNVCKNASYVSVTLIGDILLLYRTFVVWGRNYWISILPLLLLCLDFAMSVWFTWSIREARPGSSVLVSTVFARSKYFFAATLAMNLLCTLLIAYRLWAVGRAVRGYSHSSRRGASALSIVLESAAIYSTALVCLIALSITNNSAMFFFLNSMPPLIGSVFSYVILRSTSSDTKRYNPNATSTLSDHSMNRSMARSGVSHRRDTVQPLDSGVHVHLERIVHGDVNDAGDADLASDISGKRKDHAFAV
ncbi:hypothetical protein Moror_13645 [Moniliophthora roreri MCA 2997]|uniref:Uncharacterized protein n=2 Tax=Moniliophthora roreri TaxID=221103 RepID=V2XCB1_MONRO|nr:hypothetical protein Moror_13645 [Moniliophthora roreri MCA 2997]KAI3607986.1 hypothetical protein WG66_004878 [Moniliophthora roreri]